MNSLPKTVTRQRRGCDLNPGPSAPESNTLNTRLTSHPRVTVDLCNSRRAVTNSLANVYLMMAEKNQLSAFVKRPSLTFMRAFYESSYCNRRVRLSETADFGIGLTSTILASVSSRALSLVITKFVGNIIILAFKLKSL